MHTRRDWMVGAYLVILASTLAFCVLIAHQGVQILRTTRWLRDYAEKVKAQNQWSIEDRAALHRSQADTQHRLKEISSKLKVVEEKVEP